MDNSNELLTPVENKTIIKLIQEGKLEELKKYKDFAAVKIKASTAKRLVDTLIYQFDEDDENTQERLYNQLDKIMDGVAKKRYVRDKRTLRFSSVNQINDYLLNEFSRIDEYNQDFYFKKIASIINQKIGDDTFYKNCLETIKYFFTHYYKSGRLPQEVTSSFYNQILNKQEDAYINKTKNTMIKRLRRILPFTLKKEHGRITGAKLRKIDEILESKDYQKLGITEERLRELIASYDEEINKVKKIRRENFYLTKEKLHEINEQFISGKLNEAALSQILPDVNQEVRTIILKKYTLIKAKFLDKITITKDELPPIALGYHYNNYKIGTMEDMYKNIINIVSTISEEEAEDIIFNKEIPKAILELLPLVDHVIGFNTEEMIEILRSYPMVLEHMRKEKIIKEATGDKALANFFEFLKITEAYASTDDITMSILGKNIIERIRFSDKVTSKNPMDYLKVYESMLAREYTFIPRVEGEFKNYYYASAEDYDRERLLIGKNCNFSCIGPGGAGKEAYLQSLTGHNADVIMIKDKNTKEFVARSLCFRKGNYVVLAPIHGTVGIEESLYHPKLLAEIGKQMIKQSLENNDTLEYVFLSPDGRFLDDYFPLIEDSYLMDPFPHADLDESAYLITSTKDPEQVEIDSTITMPVMYKTKREKVKGKDEVDNESLTRIKALDVILTENQEDKEEKERNFELVNKDNYDDIYMGQDWYVAINDGQIVDCIILPTGQEEQTREISILKEQLNSLNMINGDTKNIEISSNRGGIK